MACAYDVRSSSEWALLVSGRVQCLCQPEVSFEACLRPAVMILTMPHRYAMELECHLLYLTRQTAWHFADMVTWCYDAGSHIDGDQQCGRWAAPTASFGSCRGCRVHARTSSQSRSGRALDIHWEGKPPQTCLQKLFVCVMVFRTDTIKAISLHSRRPAFRS